jgi:hypothetical protein
MNGDLFDFPTAATFNNESEALAYAKSFAAEQAGVGGAQIEVRTRRGGYAGHRGSTIAVFRGGTCVMCKIRISLG